MADDDDKQVDEAGEERAPSEREPARAARPAASAKPVPEGGGRTGLFRFLGECREELRRVQWPNREQLSQATMIVIVLSVVIGVYLYALDQGFSRAATWLIRQQAS